MNRDAKIETYFGMFCSQWQKTYHKSGKKNILSVYETRLIYFSTTFAVSCPGRIWQAQQLADHWITGSVDPGWAAASLVELKKISQFAGNWHPPSTTEIHYDGSWNPPKPPQKGPSRDLPIFQSFFKAGGQFLFQKKVPFQKLVVSSCKKSTRLS